LAIDSATAPATLYEGNYTDVTRPEGSGIFKNRIGDVAWTAVNTGLTGNSISALTVDPTTSGTLYAAIYFAPNISQGGGGVFKTTTGGASWSPIDVPIPITIPPVKTTVIAFAIDPITPSTVYALTADPSYGVFKSTTGGASWDPINTGLSN